MQKFRASMEPFWDLKFGEYVEYILRVYSAIRNSLQIYSVLPSLISSNGRTLTCSLASDVL